MPAPAGPSSPVFYAALYKNLSALVKSFVMYFFTPAVYKGAFFTGTLTATVFAGSYVLPKSMGGGTYFFSIGVPAPNAGAGLGFLIAAILAGCGYVYYRSRKVVVSY